MTHIRDGIMTRKPVGGWCGWKSTCWTDVLQRRKFHSQDYISLYNYTFKCTRNPSLFYSFTRCLRKRNRRPFTSAVQLLNVNKLTWFYAHNDGLLSCEPMTNRKTMMLTTTKCLSLYLYLPIAITALACFVFVSCWSSWIYFFYSGFTTKYAMLHNNKLLLYVYLLVSVVFM